MSGEKLQSFFESTGGIVVVLAVILLLFVLILRSGKEKKMDTKAMAVCALLTALSVALSYITVFRLPQGGSITLLSMLPVMLAGYLYGTKDGLIVGVAVGLVNLIMGPYVIHPAQMLLDYPLSFGAMALGAPLRNTGGKFSLPLVILVGSVCRWICHVLSGVIFFGAYAPEGMNVWVYSAAYNSFLFVEAVITMIIVMIPAVRNLIDRLKKETEK